MSEARSFHALPPPEKERILGKLQRLKALSECQTGNVHETATAAAAMTRLMLEYKIELAELQDGGSQDRIEEQQLSSESRGKAYPLWQNHLLSKLAKAHDCVGFQHTSFNRLRGTSDVKLCLVGRPEDIEQTRSLYQFCVAEIERLCYEWKPGGQVSVSLRNDFRTGAAMAIGQRVEEERQRVREEEQARARLRGRESRALAVLDRKFHEVQAAARKLGIRASSGPQGRALSASAYEAGYEAGKGLEFPSEGGSAPLRDLPHHGFSEGGSAPLRDLPPHGFSAGRCLF